VKEMFLWAKCDRCPGEFGGIAVFNDNGELDPNSEFAKASAGHERDRRSRGHNRADVFTAIKNGRFIGAVISSSETRTYFVREEERVAV
jgi:hypothetical protein